MTEFKKVNVRLVGEDGNAFAIMGRVSGALRRAGHSREVISKYQEEATSGDYDKLLRVTLKYAVHVDDPDEECDD